MSATGRCTEIVVAVIPFAEPLLDEVERSRTPVHVPAREFVERMLDSLEHQRYLTGVGRGSCCL